MGRSGDEGFIEFLGASRSDLRRTAYVLCGSWEDAEDAVQTAMCRVYLRWGRISQRGAEWSYARRAVVNAVLNIARGHSARPESVTADLPEVASSETTGTVDDRLLLRLALDSLPVRQRAVVVLRYVDQLNVAETARVLRCPEGTVTSSGARALAALRAFLRHHGVVRGTTREETS